MQQQDNSPSQPEIKTVCGSAIQDASKFPDAEYRGEKIYFCTKACLKAFLANPDAFMAGEVEHPLDDENIKALA